MPGKTESKTIRIRKSTYHALISLQEEYYERKRFKIAILDILDFSFTNPKVIATIRDVLGLDGDSSDVPPKKVDNNKEIPKKDTPKKDSSSENKYF